MENRIVNFNAGPATLPESVLKEAQDELLNYKGSGMSIMEASHRSKWFDDCINEAVADVKSLLGITDSHDALFLQGGASLQFAMVPMNLLPEGQSADYINTGTWSTKAIAQAKLLGKKYKVAASSEDRNFAYIPKELALDPQAAYVHLTSNNTIKGTQFQTFPDAGDVPLVADMSSDILSRPLPMERFGLIYAGAQKNLGPSGVCLVLVRKDMYDREPETLPDMLRYSTFGAKNSLYNTPPSFAIYMVGKVLKWVKAMGGLAAMEKHNQEKAALLYDAIDASGYYKATADKDARSLMNVTFRLPSEELEAKFVSEATKAGLGGLKGHRSVGGCRASVYNAMTKEGIAALVSFMKEFEGKNG